MKICYQVLRDSRFQGVQAEEWFADLYGNLLQDGRVLADVWRGVGELRVDNPELPEPDIFLYLLSGYVFSPEKHPLIANCLKKSGALLPVTFPGRAPHVLHFTNREANYVLDESKSERKVYNSGNLGAVKKYHFSREKIDFLGLFLLPKDVRTYAFSDEEGSSEQDFVRIYKSLGLRGLRFVEHWREEL